ncbi:DUF72 domain-containing protein [Lacinutrix undariae]
MKFGSVINPAHIKFTLPQDAIGTQKVLQNRVGDSAIKIHVGCAKWNRAELKGFYPRGTKDELTYYAKQFNAIELNATFYNLFSAEQFSTWCQKTPKGFKFFPKIPKIVSHDRQLKHTDEFIVSFLEHISNLKEKLGTVFLQMHESFSPNQFETVVAFIKNWPKNSPLAIEFRDANWFNDDVIARELYAIMETHNVANVIVDTAGRRDLLHMRLTNCTAFVRFVGANHESDYTRLSQWVTRLKTWKAQGITEINFFVHQNIEKESPLLSAYFIKELNNALGCDLKIPNQTAQHTLFL